MKKTVSVDVDINTGDVVAWLHSGVSEYDLYCVLREAALKLGTEGVEFLLENIPEAARTPFAISTLLVIKTLAVVIETSDEDD